MPSIFTCQEQMCLNVFDRAAETMDLSAFMAFAIQSEYNEMTSRLGAASKKSLDKQQRLAVAESHVAPAFSSSDRWATCATCDVGPQTDRCRRRMAQKRLLTAQTNQNGADSGVAAVLIVSRRQMLCCAHLHVIFVLCPRWTRSHNSTSTRDPAVLDLPEVTRRLCQSR